jgi:secreted trypsin-like serine protease
MWRGKPIQMLVALLAMMAAPGTASGSAIVGGQETSRDWPFMVYLSQGRQEVDLGRTFCGATLVAPTWVFTTLVFGRHAQSDGRGERIQAKRIVVHEQYAAGGPDVALVELERAPANPIPVQVAAPGEESLYAPGAPATILGWGSTRDGGSSSDVLREAQVPILPDESCGGVYSGWDSAIMVCAGYSQGGVDACQGDSGGPLLVRTPTGIWRQIGITSFGEGCGKPGFAGVYAEAAGATIREWIRARVPSAIAAPGAIAVAAPRAAVRAAKTSPAKPSKVLRRCLKKAGRSKARQRACRRVEARRARRARRS